MKRQDNGKLLSSMGLCAKAGKLTIGVPMICDAMARGKNTPLIVLEASDTSANTHKKITDKCRFYNIKCVQTDCTGEQIAAAVGKTASLAAVAITDENFCRLVEKSLGD